MKALRIASVTLVGVLCTSAPVGAFEDASPGESEADRVARLRTASQEETSAAAAELRRGVQKLRLEGAPAPYRAEARWVRAELLNLDGSYGGIISNLLDTQAIGAVEVRVGSLQRDNSNFFGSDSGIAGFDVSLTEAPKFMRKKLWLALDRAFRGATRAYAQKLVVLERLAQADLPDDLTPAPEAMTRLVAQDTTPIDREGLAAMVASLSARFADWDSIDNGDVHLQILRSHETVVNTEGLVLQSSRARAVLAVVADTRAPDGMHLDHGAVLHLQEIPTASDELLAQGEAMVDKVLAELDALARAPMIEEEYDGPILFVGDAAAQLLASTVATEAAGTPAPLGDGGRMMDLEPTWQKHLGKNVLPPFLDLVDDPTGNQFGSYDVDAEGVLAEPLTLVDDGVLERLLMTRVPNEKVSGTNGRARMSPALEVGPAISNLRVESKRRGVNPIALERELLARAREDGYEFAYVIESLRDGGILGPVPRETAAAYAGTGKIDLPLPARVYRIEPGGTRTLVRGAILAPASMRVLRRIRAIGQELRTVRMRIPVGSFGGFGADVGIDGILTQTVDVSVTTPDLLIEGLELLVERGEHERLPTLTHPLRRKKTAENEGADKNRSRPADKTQ